MAKIYSKGIVISNEDAEEYNILLVNSGLLIEQFKNTNKEPTHKLMIHKGFENLPQIESTLPIETPKKLNLDTLRKAS